GLRGHALTSPARWRAMTALLLLMPSTPMLFQGQEFSASAPFLYFADFDAELNAAVRRGRSGFLCQFPSIANATTQAVLADPAAPAHRRASPQRVRHLMADPIRRIPWPPPGASDPESLVTREWLVSNGLGGYASGTVPGVITRRYHGLLIAALPAPLGRVVMLNHLTEDLRLPEWKTLALGGKENPAGTLELHGADLLTEFRL